MKRVLSAVAAAALSGGALLADARTPSGAPMPSGVAAGRASTDSVHSAEPSTTDGAGDSGADAGATPARIVDGDHRDWRAPTSHFGGTSQIVDGELVYQDFIYDDYGADTANPRNRQEGVASWDKTIGDFRYPTDENRFVSNAADIHQIRLAVDGDDVHVLVRFNSLRERDTTVVTLAFDVDGDDTTGGGPWPYQAGIRSSGSDVFLTLWGDGGALSTPGSAPQPLGSIGGVVAVDTESNAFEAAVPRAALPGDRWRLHAASGLWDSGEWMAVPADPPTATRPGYGSALVAARAFNVAFRPQEYQRVPGLLVGPRRGTEQGAGGFFDDEQAETLVDGDISRFALDVDVTMLTGRATALYAPETGYSHQVVTEQSFTIPPLHEGRTFGNPVPGRNPGGIYGSGYHFFGPRQPFGVYLPAAHDGDTELPLVMVLHGRGGNHRTVGMSPGFTADVAEDAEHPRMIVTPLGRGSWNMYTDYGEKDVMEVLDWAVANLPVDESAVYLAGYSMGGYGTLRLGSLYPDRFAAAVDWTGYSGEILGHSSVGSAWRQYAGDAGGLGTAWGDRSPGFFPYASGNPVDFLEGMRHVPLLKLAGTNDEAMPVISQIAPPLRLDELGYEHRFHLYPGYDHFAFALADEWSDASDWLSQWRLDPAPRQVTYKFSEGLGNAELGIRHGNAYWLRDMRVRAVTDPTIISYGSVDATSLAIAGRATTPRRVREPRPGPPAFLELGTTLDPGDALPVDNELELDLENLATIAVDLGRAALDPTAMLSVAVTTDGPSVVRLDGWTGPAPSAMGMGDSVVVSYDDSTQSVVIDIRDAGTFTLQLEPQVQVARGRCGTTQTAPPCQRGRHHD